MRPPPYLLDNARNQMFYFIEVFPKLLSATHPQLCKFSAFVSDKCLFYDTHVLCLMSRGASPRTLNFSRVASLST